MGPRGQKGWRGRQAAGPGGRGRPHEKSDEAADPTVPTPGRRRESGPPPSRLGPALDPPALPVLAGCDHAVLLGDEQRGRDGVLVPLDLAQQHRAAALRPGVDLGRHVRTAAAAAAAAVFAAGGPSADGRAGTCRFRFGSSAVRVPHRRKLPSAAANDRIGWGRRATKITWRRERPLGICQRRGETHKG